ncbi:hypothetical protein LIER_10463 [Lithospermum erythrorhizon]|uniref:Myb-like domain-containing protein n=1 Tax=Lithospermum erythrorhizon TaxID=34254 RepID=A0AAV3PKN8_LITER
MGDLNMEANNPWVLAIEALLHMKQVDLPIILELIKDVPDISDELGRNARELLAIRVLENLYSREICKKNSSVPSPGSKAKIDDSHFCEEVVNHILQVESPEQLRFDEANIMELDVPSFIFQKRSHMQKSSLHQLKNGILEGSNPILEPLKDGSKLEVPDENGRNPMDSCVSDGIADKHGVTKNTEHKRKLASFNAEDDKISEENLPVKNVSPGEKDSNTGVSGNFDVVASAGPCGTFEESSKKLKLDLLGLQQKIPELPTSACQREPSGDSSSRTVEHIEDLVDGETRPEVHPMEESKGKQAHCAHASVEANNDIDHGVVLHMSREVDAHVNISDKPSDDNGCALEPPAVTVNVNFEDEEEKGSSEANDTINLNIQYNVDHAMNKDNDVHGVNLETSSDSDEFHDVRGDIAISKNSFLSSQGMDTQDSLGTQLNRCVRCNKDGNLLVCSSSSCPFVVHEECLGPASNFERMEDFYCPFCAYSRAISRYLEVKKNFSLARTELSAFLAFRAELEEKSSPKKFSRSKKHGSSKIQNKNKNTEPSNNHDSLNDDIGPLIPPTKLPGHVGEPSKSAPRVETPCVENEKSGSRDQDIISGRKTRDRICKKKELVCRSDSDANSAPECTDDNAKESSNAESETSDACRYCIRPRKQGRQIMEPISQRRRKKMPWTNEEEQTLKEGVRRFASEDDKVIPWKQIWEFGADVFQQRRNTVDLKDKWRNICKGSPRSI